MLCSPGVRQLVSFNGAPALIEDAVLAFLMQQATPEGVIIARSNFKPGQEVYISGCPFEGLAAIIQKPPDSKGRVKVLLKLLSRQVKAQVPVQFIKADWDV